MIYYRKGWAGLFVVFRFAGTAWPFGVFPGILSASVGLGLSFVEKAESLITDEDRFIENPYPFQLFAYLVGFVIVFRTNFAYQRYWESVDAVQRMGAKLIDGACMVVAFDAPADPEQAYLCETVMGQSAISEHAQDDAVVDDQALKHRLFFAEVVHMFSVLHAIALLYLRSDSDLDNIQAADDKELVASAPMIPRNVSLSSGFSQASVAKTHSQMKVEILGELLPEERALLETDARGMPVHSKARVTMITTWIFRRLIHRQKHEKAGDLSKTSPPIVSRIYQVMSDGLLAFGQASKIAETPFPFPYQNLIRDFLWIFAFSCPFVINAKILHKAARFVITFICVWAYFSLAWVGDNLEDPFLAYDANELPLLTTQHNFNRRLVALGLVPKVMADPGARSSSLDAESTSLHGTANEFAVASVSTPAANGIGAAHPPNGDLQAAAMSTGLDRCIFALAEASRRPPNIPGKMTGDVRNSCI